MSPLAIIFVTVFIDLLGFGIIIPLLPFYAESFGASAFTIGLLGTVFSLMQFIVAPLCGRWSDRIGRRPIIVGGLLVSCLAYVALALADSLALIFVARIIGGIAGGNVPAAQAYIADVTTPETRSKWMGMIGAAFGLGFTFGPMIGGIMSRISYSAPFYFAAALTVANVVLLYFILPESLPKEHRAKPHEDAPVVEVFRHGNGWLFGLVVATYFFLIVGFTIMTAFFALFTFRRFGYDAHANGYLFGFIGIITVIVQGGLIGRLVAIFGETTLARAGLLITAASLALLPFCHNLTWLLVACVGLSLGSGFSSPPLNGLASQLVDRSWQGRALGVVQSAGSTARLIGPLLGGWLLMLDLHKPTTRYGETAFFAAALLCLIGAALAFCIRKPADDRSPASIPIGSSV